MLKISYAGCLGLYLAIWVQFTLEMRVLKSRQIHQNPYRFDIPKKLVASARYNL